MSSDEVLKKWEDIVNMLVVYEQVVDWHEKGEAPDAKFGPLAEGIVDELRSLVQDVDLLGDRSWRRIADLSWAGMLVRLGRELREVRR